VEYFAGTLFLDPESSDLEVSLIVPHPWLFCDSLSFVSLPECMISFSIQGVSLVEGKEYMSQSRIDAFKSLLEEQPDEAMIWYGLANEYLKLEHWGEATAALQNVLRCNAEYTAAYQMLGTALLSQGNREEARRVWTEGLAVATRTGAWSARSHMERLLAQTGGDASSEPSDNPATEFCS
jgi:tetratricopeptide (TPR) repeat protein